MIYLSTRTKDIGRQQCARIINMSLRWCMRKLGENNRKKYSLNWYIQKQTIHKDMGEYDGEDHEIFIYWNNNKTVQDLIETCIHEYTHSKQPIVTKYWKYPGSYSRNPYERQAKYNEKKYLPECWDHINNKINKQYATRNRSTKTLRSSVSKKA